MKSYWIFVLAMVAAKPVFGGEAGCVTVQMQGSIEVPFRTLQEAQLLNMELYKEIGVAVKWEEAGRRRKNAECVPILMEFHSKPAREELPGALAFAMPYEVRERRIRIFVERVLGTQRTGTQAAMQLGYVMAHEIGHILEGVSRHSVEGVMKEQVLGVRVFTTRLRFAPVDVGLIHAGLKKMREQ